MRKIKQFKKNIIRLIIITFSFGFVFNFFYMMHPSLNIFLFASFGKDLSIFKFWLSLSLFLYIPGLIHMNNFERLLKKNKRYFFYPFILNFFIWFLMSFPATFASPYGGEMLTFMMMPSMMTLFFLNIATFMYYRRRFYKL